MHGEMNEQIKHSFSLHDHLVVVNADSHSIQLRLLKNGHYADFASQTIVMESYGETSNQESNHLRALIGWRPLPMKQQTCLPLLIGAESVEKPSLHGQIDDAGLKIQEHF